MSSAPNRFAIHLLAGLSTAFALSIVFWLAFGVFNIAGLFIWSIVIGFIGAAFGTWRKSLAQTLIATAILRVLHFILIAHFLSR